ncbi:MAG: GNAT family N-acetyltransferase [Microscillaceae bacterium]
MQKHALAPEYELEMALPADAEALACLQEAMALETEHLRLDAATIRAGVAALLADPHKGIYYKITHQNQLVGCVLTTFEWSDWRNGQILWIQSLYILPAHRGKKLYSATYRYFQALVQQRPDWCGIRLYVDKTNQAARAVYQALGMDNGHYEMFEWID